MPGGEGGARLCFEEERIPLGPGVVSSLIIWGRPTHPRAAGLLLTLPAEIAASAACPAKGIESAKAAGACAQRTLLLLLPRSTAEAEGCPSARTSGGDTHRDVGWT